MWEGGGGQDGVEWGGKWDNCNSIINKYIKKKKKRTQRKICSRGPNQKDISGGKQKLF